MSLFTPELLQSFDQLRAYFAGTKEVAEIQSLAQHQSLTYYEGIWWMAASEVFAELQARIAPLIKQLIVPLLNKVGASNLAIRCEVVADHLNANVKAICAVAKFGAKYIAPIRDIHQITTSDFYLQSPIPVSSLSDERVAKLAHAKKPMINFYHRYGSCRGIANWFLALYNKTKAHFADPVQHMIALSAQFDGTPCQAALLHSLGVTEPMLLDMPYGKVFVSRNRSHLESELRRLRASCEFGFTLGKCHRINFIKKSDELGFIVDSACGILKLEGADLNTRLSQYIDEWMQKNSPHLFKVRVDYYFYDPEQKYHHV